MSSDLFLYQYKFYLKYINAKFMKEILRDFYKDYCSFYGNFQVILATFILHFLH